MKKLFSLLPTIAMLLMLCVTAFADNPVEAQAVAVPLQEMVEPYNSMRSVEYVFHYDLGVNERAECSDFYAYYAGAPKSEQVSLAHRAVR